MKKISGLRRIYMKLRIPDKTTVVLANETLVLASDLTFDGGCVAYDLDSSLKVSVKSEKQGVSFIYLRWNENIDKSLKVLGDAWERGYGDLEWKLVDPERNMPWYMAISNGSDTDFDYFGRLTQCFGVGVLPNAMALWSCDGEGVTLCLDVRCGCLPVELGNSVLDVATVHFRDYENTSAFLAIKDFCHVMSPAPILADHVVYGSNNWYYAYGESSHEEIIADTKFVKSMCEGAKNIPYMVIDDGWQPNRCDAPWDRGNEKFPDMKALADQMKEIGVRPGIWVRYLINGKRGESRMVDSFPEEWYTQRSKFVLDPSHPKVLEYVRETTQRLVDWGYTLIKHDFSTYDIFGLWGFRTKEHLANGDWGFYDKTKTTAQIIKNFYTVIKEAAGDTVIIGCNVIGHLCAGIHEFNRTGDDTSGREWARTKKMGVNTLAFRIAQNNAFFGADADCVGIMGLVDWKLNSQWLKLLSRSGSCLFVSCKPGILSESEAADLREGFLVGSEQSDELVPIDWMETLTPSRYLINGEEVVFDWGE